MYIYHALINTLNAHMIHFNLSMIFYTHVEHSPTKTIYIKYYTKIYIYIYTKGLADLNQNGPSRILTLADDGLIYKTSKDSQEAAEAVQQNSLSRWCYDTGSLISRDKARTLWCTLDNRATGKRVPAVTFAGAVVERISHQIPKISLGSTLTEKWPTKQQNNVETTALKCKKCLSVAKAMDAKGIEQSHLFLLFIKVWCSVSLTTD